jgi:hypothetical protein
MQPIGGKKLKVKGFTLRQHFAKYKDIRLTPGQPLLSCLCGGFLSRKASAVNF